MSSLISKNLQVGSDPTATNNFTIFQPATPDGTLRIGNGNTGITSSLLTLTSAGNFGIGGSPSYLFDVNGKMRALSGYALTSDGSNFTPAGASQIPNYGIGSPASAEISMSGFAGLRFYTNQLERLRLDASGNLGLGVTPNTSSASGKTFQIRNTLIEENTNGYAIWRYNNYFDGGASDRYIANGAACAFQLAGNIFRWYTAPSGTAGNAISFTQAMTLTAAGDLLVGQTVVGETNSNGFWTYPTGGKFGQNHTNGTSSGAAYAQWAYNGSIIGSITQNGTTAVAYNISSDYRLKNITGPITTSGAYIDSLNPVEGTWKADGSTFVGLIAHEVQEASRTPVATGTKDGEQMQGMDYSSAEIIANMLAELKSLRARVAQLEAK